MPDDQFLIDIDGMIESTEEFLLDDSSHATNGRERLDIMIRNKDGRMKDLLALEHVRKLYVDVFQTKEN